MSIPFSEDIAIVKATPAVQYYAMESQGVFHEDREVDGAMYRVANAYYSAGIWHKQTSGQPAFGTVLNTDGSVNYLYAPPSVTSWESWQGVAQPEIYNAISYGLSTSPSAASSNPTALAQAILAAIDGGGGTVFIPPGSYYFEGPVSLTVAGNDPGIIIAGASGGTTLIQMQNGSTFAFSGFSTGNGVRLRDLTIYYAVRNGSAISVEASTGVICERVQFTDCAVLIDDSASARTGLVDCSANLSQGAGNQIMVSLAGAADFVTECVLYQRAIDPSDPDAIFGVTGIAISGTECRISSTHFNNFSTGITITDGATNVFFENVRVDAFSQGAVLTQSDSFVFGVFFSNCAFAMGPNSTDLTSGVTLQATTGSALASIVFDNCTAYGWQKAGIEIDAGTNVVVSGGQYSSNGQGSTAGALGAGIAITNNGAVSLVTLAGIDCTGIYQLWDKGASVPPPTQPRGISITGGSNITISGCNLTGNASSGLNITGQSGSIIENVFISSCDASGYTSYLDAINVTASGSELSNAEISDCAGYNDAGVSLTTSAPTSGFSGATFNYYGPTAFFGSGAELITVEIDGHSTRMANGTFLLGLGQTATYIAFQGYKLWTQFLMIGL